MLRLPYTANFVLLMAGTPHTVTAFVAPPDGVLTTHVNSFTGLPCTDTSCNKVIETLDLPTAFIQNSTQRDTSLAVKDSPVAILISPVAKNKILALRDTASSLTTSTTTVTISEPLVTSTISTLIDDASSISPPPVAPVNHVIATTTNISSLDKLPTIVSNGNPISTITGPESSLSVMPAPNITSSHFLTTPSNATIIPTESMPTFSNTTSASIRVNSASSTGHISTVTSVHLTTVDPPAEATSDVSGTPAGVTPTTSTSHTGFVQNSGHDFTGGLDKLRLALLTGVVMNVVLAAVL